MVRQGRPPEPNRKLQLRGSRYAENDIERGASVEPVMPDWMEGEAAAEWKRIVPELSAAGLLTLADRASLIALCESWAEWRRMEEKKQGDGYFALNGSGSRVRSPEAIQGEAAFKRWKGMMQEFGMSPSARRGLDWSKSKTADDKAALLDG